MNYNKAELCKDCKKPVQKLSFTTPHQISEAETKEITIISDLLDEIYRNRDIGDYARAYARPAVVYQAYRQYGMRGLKTQVLYVLNNLRSWRGPEAKRIKARLKRFTR